MSCTGMPYYPLTNAGVRDATKVNADLAYLCTGINAGTGATGLKGETGVQGVTGDPGGPMGPQGYTGVQGIQGQTGVRGPHGGAQGETGLANFMQESFYPTGWEPAVLLWNNSDEALFAGVTGVNEKWVQISAGSVAGSTGVKGATGPHGDTGLANWMQESYFPTGCEIPILLWNHIDEALYALCTGMSDHWTQISAGAQQGATGVQGETGAQGETGLQGAMGGYTGVWAVTMNGQNSVYETGVVGDYQMPFDCMIYEWTFLCEPTGTLHAGVWSDSYANFPPTSADSLHGDTGPWITAGVKNQQSVGWTASAGEIVRVKLTGNDAATMASLNMRFSRR